MHYVDIETRNRLAGDHVARLSADYGKRPTGSRAIPRLVVLTIVVAIATGLVAASAHAARPAVRPSVHPAVHSLIRLRVHAPAFRPSVRLTPCRKTYKPGS